MKVGWSFKKMSLWKKEGFLYYIVQIILFFCIILSIFILYSRESELYRYILDGTSALAWELPFSRCLDHLSFK